MQLDGDVTGTRLSAAVDTINDLLPFCTDGSKIASVRRPDRACGKTSSTAVRIAETLAGWLGKQEKTDKGDITSVGKTFLRSDATTTSVWRFREAAAVCVYTIPSDP